MVEIATPNAVVIEAVLPDAFLDEAIGLVATVHHSADEPAGSGWCPVHSNYSQRLSQVHCTNYTFLRCLSIESN
jgi:hypothetical protein